jgi:hypothetical protein
MARVYQEVGALYLQLIEANERAAIMRSNGPAADEMKSERPDG